MSSRYSEFSKSLQSIKTWVFSPSTETVSRNKSLPRTDAAYRPTPLRPCITLPEGLFRLFSLSDVDGTIHLPMTSSLDIPCP